METPFPETAEDFLSPPFSPESMEMALAAIDLRYGALRSPEVLASYLNENFTKGTYFLYGAGTQSKQVKKILEKHTDVIIKGFIDRRARQLGWVEGLPVFDLDQNLLDEIQDTDGIIICHATREPEMIEGLLTCGIPQHFLRPIFTGTSIRPCSAQAIRQKIDHIHKTLAHGFDVVAISTLAHQYSVVPVEDLAQIVGNDRILHLTFGRPEFVVSDPGTYEHLPLTSIDLGLSTNFLEAILKSIEPKVIITTLSPHSDGEFLPIWLQYHYPDARQVHQFYDMAGLFNSLRLRTSHGYSADYISLARLGDFVACRGEGMVVTKHGGPLWDKLSDDFNATAITYLPGLKAKGMTSTDPREDIIRIVFAGSLSRWSEEDEKPEHTDLNYMDYFRHLESAPELCLDMFNAAHADGRSDENYWVYLNKYSDPDGRFRYFRRMAQDKLIARMSGYDIGWLLCHNDVPEFYEPISRVVMANKMTAYLQAGLPIVMDRSYSFMSQLIDSYGAGFSAGWADREHIGKMLKSCDLTKMKSAAHQLYRDLQQANKSAIDQISHFLGQN